MGGTRARGTQIHTYNRFSLNQLHFPLFLLPSIASMNEDRVQDEGNFVNDGYHARDHGYLPTPQPLYPEDWVQAGRYRLTRSSEDDEHTSTQKHGEQTAAVGDGSNDFTIVPPPPGIYANLRSRNRTSLSGANLLEHHVIQPPTIVLPILEIDNVVLFPGSTLPLRLHDPQWVDYLGDLIADARGIYGAHANQSEVRIGIVPRMIRRRTRRHPHDAGARTGRWRVDLIRRGVTSIRRPRSRARDVAFDAGAASSITRDDNTQDEAQRHDVRLEALIRHQETNHLEENNDDDGIFHASPSRTRSVQHNDPLIGRIGTIATVIFTHEETTNLVDVSANNNRSEHQSSMVWRRQTEELIVTAIGTTRFCVTGAYTRNHEEKTSVHVPLYEVEELVDCNVSVPLSLLQRPGISKTPLLTSIGDEDAENEYDNDHEEFSNDHMIISILSHRTSIPIIALKALWPWRISRNICTIIQRTDAFQGISSALPYAAGVQKDTNRASIRVVDNLAFANWLSSNLPLDQNDRLDILEMHGGVTEQLIYILQKIRGMAQPKLRCRYCGMLIADMSMVFTVDGAEGTTGAYVNECGIVHQTITVRKILPECIHTTGGPETKDSWSVNVTYCIGSMKYLNYVSHTSYFLFRFPGYSWTISNCNRCHFRKLA